MYVLSSVCIYIYIYLFIYTYIIIVLLSPQLEMLDSPQVCGSHREEIPFCSLPILVNSLWIAFTHFESPWK